MKLFGYKVNLELLLCAVVVYFLLSGYTVCSCSKVSGLEAFQTLSSSLVGSNVNYKMGEGVKGSWENKKMNDYPDEETNIGEPIALNKTMFLLKSNKGDANSCPSSYSSSTGCVGLTTEQSNFLNSRGGNRSYGNY